MLRSDTSVVVSSAAGHTVITRYRHLPNGALVCERMPTDSAPDSDMLVVVHGAAPAPAARGHRGQAGQRQRRSARG